jgi:uncharacterized protein DUF1707
VNNQDATWSGPNRLRTSDAEREQVATILRAAMTEGRLTLAEGEERLGACYAARYRDELVPLTADLPDQGRRALAETPQAVAEVKRGLRRHARVVVAVSLILTGLWALSGAHFFWPLIPMIFLFLSLRAHGRQAYYHHGRERIAPWNAPR